MKTILSWSTGKDAAWSLHILRQNPDIEVVGLLTTINTQFDRVAMHGVRRTLLQAQAKAAGLPLYEVPIPYPCPNEVYEARMAEFVERAKADCVEAFAFGDLFLRDIRSYREAKLKDTGMTPLFPLWEIGTQKLARDMMAGGLQARIVCLDTRLMPRELAGASFDSAFLDRLPASVDPCGENGEFHTFAHAGPMFREAIPIEMGAVVERDGFMFADILEAAGAVNQRAVLC